MFSDVSDEQIDMQAETNITGERFLQLVSIIVGGMASAIEALKRTTAFLGGMAAAALAVGMGEFERSGELANAAAENMVGFGDAVVEAFWNGTESAGQFFGIVDDGSEEAVEAVEEVADAVDDVADSSDAAAAAIDEMNAAFEGLKQRIDDEATRRQLDETRRQIKEQLQLSFRIEDIERNHQDRLNQIHADAQKRRSQLQDDAEQARIDLAKARADRALQIEQDYQQRLKDIQTSFHREAEELARSRDAIGLLRLMRQKQYEVNEERKSVEQRRRENEENFQKQALALEESLAKQQKDLDAALQEQLASVEDQRQKQYEALERQLERQRQLRELERQWEEEDRQAALKKELEDMVEHFSEMEGITAEGLAGVLEEWDDYFTDLAEIRQEFLELQQDIAALATQTMSAASLRRGSSFGFGAGMLQDRDPRTNPNYDVGIFGQAGQVSQQLAQPTMAPPGPNFQPQMFTPQQVAPLPAASPGPSIDRREIIVKAEGFSPEAERIVVRTLTEIERNRGR